MVQREASQSAVLADLVAVSSQKIQAAGGQGSCAVTGATARQSDTPAPKIGRRLILDLSIAQYRPSRPLTIAT
jgi:hypothetical protein